MKGTENIIKNIKQMFYRIRQRDKKLTDDCREFVNSLHRYFGQKKHLSERQFLCLRSIADGVKMKRTKK